MDKVLQLRKITRDESLIYNSNKIPVKPNQKYNASAEFLGKTGEPYSVYFTVIILGDNDKESTRHIKWINDFSGTPKLYNIVFTVPPNVRFVSLGYRINVEVPVKSDLEIGLPNPVSFKLEESNETEDQFDDRNDFVVPKFSPLTEEEENILEKRMVWILGWPRSGTTWLGTQLLNHRANIIWNEPFIAWHLIPRSWQLKSDQYFFSPLHKKNWLPVLRKFILNRTYSHAQTLEKNIIIKEPLGGEASEIIMECLPNSKLIFLLRDGRDIIDSLIDAHKDGSWNKELEPLTSEQMRHNKIKQYANQWSIIMGIVSNAYKNHNPLLRLLVKYEDLRNNTFAELKKIYDFLGTSIDDKELQLIVNQYDFKNIVDSEKGPGKFNRLATPGGWKMNFTEKEKEMMNRIMSSTLIKLGYQV